VAHFEVAAAADSSPEVEWAVDFSSTLAVDGGPTLAFQ